MLGNLQVAYSFMNCLFLGYGLGIAAIMAILDRFLCLHGLCGLVGLMGLLSEDGRRRLAGTYYAKFISRILNNLLLMEQT